MSQGIAQVIFPMDVVKLGMVIAYAMYQSHWQSTCSLAPWLFNLWKIMLGELGLKFLTQACCPRLQLTNLLISFVLLAETGWNVYGLYLYFTRSEQCSEETELAFKVALGLYVASNFSAILLSLFRPAPPEKAHSS